MYRRSVRVSLLVGAFTLSACVSASPPSRIGDYVTKDDKIPPNAVIMMPEQRPIQAGLLVIADKADPGSAPGLPDEALVRFREELKEEFGQGLPFMIAQVIQADGIAPNRSGGELTRFRELGKKYDVEHLALVVVSSVEVEVPKQLDLGGATQGTPGLQRDNYALAEFALVDLKAGQTLMQAVGQGWATLLRPYVPGMSPRYPVVYIRPGDRQRVWPPTWEGSPDTLRVVSFNLAGKALINRLNRVWLDYLETGAAAGPAEK
ncbi:MAG TPA: hypothetical protein VLE03_06760 [Nitrospiraceae bacterium]|nr:hypothetical protein [Nitrospiraceae bacterium]